ncbi:MAG: stage III sporulation protein AF [Clostridia bacterium]|nr:stage III sporulation protein AF [Clostridia bacterium]
MTAYILSILGIVVAGIIIDIIVPSGTINKYIKSIYGIFVVAVIINPIIKFFNQHHDFNFTYKDYEVSEKLLNYINNSKIKGIESNIEKELEENGFKNVDIIIIYSSSEDQLVYNSCNVNLNYLSIDADKQHINRYEYIINVIAKHTNLTAEEIVFNE